MSAETPIIVGVGWQRTTKTGRRSLPHSPVRSVWCLDCLDCLASVRNPE